MWRDTVLNMTGLDGSENSVGKGREIVRRCCLLLSFLPSAPDVQPPDTTRIMIHDWTFSARVLLAPNMDGPRLISWGLV